MHQDPFLDSAGEGIFGLELFDRLISPGEGEAVMSVRTGRKKGWEPH